MSSAAGGADSASSARRVAKQHTPGVGWVRADETQDEQKAHWEVVLDKNVNPSHEWRHRFKTVGIDLKIEMRVLDALQGHAPPNVSAEYGEVSIQARANAIAKFPNIET